MASLGALAKAGVPLLHVCDKTDPWFNDQTKVVDQRYKELGGEITVIINENDARSPLASDAQTRAVDFMIGKTGVRLRSGASPGRAGNPSVASWKPAVVRIVRRRTWLFSKDVQVLPRERTRQGATRTR